MAQLVKLLLCKRGALSSVPSTHRKGLGATVLSMPVLSVPGRQGQEHTGLLASQSNRTSKDKEQRETRSQKTRWRMIEGDTFS